MNDSKSTMANGITFGGLLTCIFIALKLLKVITWSWIWVLSPLWILTVIRLAIFIILFIIISRS